jgi:predicted enzyme related to lactoylglutathione lyase
MIYIQVADCHASTAKAAELGAKICMGPMDLPKTGTMSVLGDPQGAMFALFEVARRG